MVDNLINERIAKKIANSGLCSRREAERLINNGCVKLNGNVIKNCNINVTKKDIIEVNNQKLKAKEKVKLWLYYKKKGFLVTTKDAQGRPNIFDEIKLKFNKRLISIGRLDYNSEGLLLLTNNGDFARKLELPQNKFQRTYKVRIFGKIDNKIKDKLKNGIIVNSIKYKPIELELEEEKGKNRWLTMTLYEGKNREIRKIMDHFGCTVNRLIRISYGPFNLKDLKPGQLTELKYKNFNKLLKS